MMVLKRKQIVVLSLILMIVVAGYLQYSYNNSGSSGNDSDDISVSQFDEETESLGEAWYVDNTTICKPGIKKKRRMKRVKTATRKRTSRTTRLFRLPRKQMSFLPRQRWIRM